MLLDAGGEHRTGRSAARLRESPEQQAAANLPRGVLDDRQVQALGLLPVAGDIVEILGIRADLLKQRPSGFDRREVLLALTFLLAWFQQTVFAPDALDGHMGDGKVELALQSGCTKGGELLTQNENLLFDGVGRFVRAGMMSTAVLAQTGRTLLLITAQPLAHGRNRGNEQARGGLDADLPSRLDQSQTMVVSVSHLTHQIEVANVGHTRSLAAPGPALPPAGPLTPQHASDSCTPASLGGYDEPFQFQFSTKFDKKAAFGLRYNLVVGCHLNRTWSSRQEAPTPRLFFCLPEMKGRQKQE